MSKNKNTKHFFVAYFCCCYNALRDTHTHEHIYRKEIFSGFFHVRHFTFCLAAFITRKMYSDGDTQKNVICADSV